jgi:hypothetical protein
MAEPYLAAAAALATVTGLPETSHKLLLALDRASERFRDAVGHPVTLVEDETIILDGVGGELLLLPAAPVTELTSVKVRGTVVTDYEASLRAGTLRRTPTTGGGMAAEWPDGLGNIEVTYSHGNAVVPGGIQDAVLEHAATLLLAPIGVQQETAGSQSITWGLQATTGVTQKWEEAVARYRLSGGDRS